MSLDIKKIKKMCSDLNASVDIRTDDVLVSFFKITGTRSNMVCTLRIDGDGIRPVRSSTLDGDWYDCLEAYANALEFVKRMGYK